MVNHMALTNPQRLQFWCNIFTSFLVNLLLDPIGMLIPWLKKILDHKYETPNFGSNYPKLRLQRRVGLFNLSLGRFGFCNPRLFKSWEYLNAMIQCLIKYIKFLIHSTIFIISVKFVHQLKLYRLSYRYLKNSEGFAITAWQLNLSDLVATIPGMESTKSLIWADS